MTRIFIYLLALLTGFSGAEAARPMSAAPAELGTSAIALAAVDAILVAPASEQQPASEIPTLAESATVVAVPAQLSLIAAPVYRSDRARE